MTIPEALQMAVQQHRAGRLAEAETLYRQILAAQPNHADALHLVGLIALQVGRHDLAVEWIRKAVAVNPGGVQYRLNLGNALAAGGLLDDAIASYRQAIQIKPDYPEAHNNLAAALCDRGQFEEAVAASRIALQLKCDFPEAHNNLGNALTRQGRFDDAIASYLRALQVNPGYPDAHNNLGNALRERGRFDESAASCRRALQLKPDYAEAHNNLGDALRDQGKLDEAIAAYRRSLELKPGVAQTYDNLGSALTKKGELDGAIPAFREALRLKPAYPEAWNNLGGALAGLGQIEEAITVFRRALEFKPDSAAIHYNLGNALRDRGHLDEAVAEYRRALQIDSGYAEAYNNLGITLRLRGELEEAIAAHRHALRLKPDGPEAHNNLGNILKDQGELDEAIAEFRRALEIDPKEARIHSNLIYALHFHPDSTDGTIAEEQRRWNRQFSDPLKQSVLPHRNDRSPERRLKVGYVSADFREHVVGRNLLPLFRGHDSRGFEIICYSGVVQTDKLTDEFRRLSGQWRNTLGVGDDALAAMIRCDGVDVLVDLSQHLEGNRLPVFARRPAPVLASFAGYPDSTGVDAIEYRISDRYLEAGRGKEGSDGKTRLIDSFWCYDPCGLEVESNSLPALENGFVTFGCLNNFCKVNERALGLWARLLERVGNSRLVLLSNAGSHWRRTLRYFEEQGIDAGRVEFEEIRPRREYLELYRQVDIAVDTFPYNGHTTSLDALWMGVPVVSLAGSAPVSRAGLSQLTNLGLADLVAHSGEDYVEIAVALTRDLSRLEQLRSTLRGRLKNSVLMDAPRFAREVEKAYREMWGTWCREQTDPGGGI